MNLAKAVLIGMSFIPLIGWAQKNEIWADLTLYKNLSSKITLFGDAGPRINVDGNSTAGFYLRPSVSFLVSKKMMVGGGVAWFYAHSKEGVINEVRGWQGIRIEQRILNRVLMSNFTRLEERNFFSDGQYEFLLRFRSLFGVNVLLNQTTLQKGTWYIPLAFEIFEDLNDHETLFFNRRRFYSGVGYAISDQTRVELFYIANESRADQEVDFETVNAIRLRIHVTCPNVQL